MLLGRKMATLLFPSPQLSTAASWRLPLGLPLGARAARPHIRRRWRPQHRETTARAGCFTQPLPAGGAGAAADGRSTTSAAAAAGESSSVAGIDENDTVPFTVYDPITNADYWATRPVTVLKRWIRIGAALAGWYMDGRWHKGSSVQGLSDLRAESLLRMLTNLGPAFIKIGQAVSSRPDLVPPEYLRELEKLQDQIPPFSTDKALRVIREEYGVPASAIFADLSPEPLAAASLGQVYKATLRSSGEPVAVKVQRPGVAASIALDVFILRQLAVVVRQWRKLNTDLPALLDGWAASLFTELDYRVEAANGKRFKELYSMMEDVFVPTMFLEMTTRKVLVMEWVDGERLRTAYTQVGAGQGARGSSDDLRLVEVGVRCSLEQMLEQGFYHADPHPGNLLRTYDGRLAYLDFGMMGQIDGNIRRALIRATLHLVNREFEALADDFIELGLLPEGSNREEIVPALTGVFEEALKGGVSNLSFGELSGNLGRTMYRFKFQIPSYYSLLVRSLSVLEGIALASDPNYKVLGAAYPWVARRLLTESNPELRATLRTLLYKGGRFNFDRMESLITQAVKPVGRRRLGGSSAAAAGAARAQQAEPPRGDALALLLSPEGDFVRGIVTEELAKGIDAAWRVAADAAVGQAQQQVLDVVRAEGPVAGAPFLPPPFGEVVSRGVLESLMEVPQLADDGDREQVDGMLRLGKALQETSGGSQQEGPSGGSWFKEAAGAAACGSPCTNPLEGALSTLDTTAGVLRWIALEAESLGPAERAEALRLPVDVGNGVAARVVARVIKWLAVGEGGAEGTGAAAAAAEGRAQRAAAREERQRRQVRGAGARTSAAPAASTAGAAAASGSRPAAAARPTAAAPSGSRGVTTASTPLQRPAAQQQLQQPAAAPLNGKPPARAKDSSPAGGSESVKASGGGTVSMRPLSTTATAGTLRSPEA